MLMNFIFPLQTPSGLFTGTASVRTDRRGSAESHGKAYCILHAAYCMWHVPCCILHFAHCMLDVAYCMRYLHSASAPAYRNCIMHIALHLHTASCILHLQATYCSSLLHIAILNRYAAAVCILHTTAACFILNLHFAYCGRMLHIAPACSPRGHNTIELMSRPNAKRTRFGLATPRGRSQMFAHVLAIAFRNRNGEGRRLLV